MQENQVNIDLRVRFRRWSRKSYAVFASLGKIISIGNLTVHMACDSLFREVIESVKFVFEGDAEKECALEDENPALLSGNAFIINLITLPAEVYPAAEFQYQNF